jgi:hypothetical protein
MGAAVAALVVPVAAQAQQITTGIEGTVTTDAGAPLAGAEVIITDVRTGNSRTVTTAASGSFSAQGLVPGGPYSVTASFAGYEGQTVENLVTNLQGATNLTFALTSGAGDIVVTASRASVTQLAVGPGQSFGAEMLENAPSYNRDIRDVLRVDPRVSLDRDDTGSGQDRVSCLGGNDRTNTFTVDGIVQGDVYGLNDTPFASRGGAPIPYDVIRETQVQFAPFDVEYGQFTGCAINVITKSGTNQFHGTAFFEYIGTDMRGDFVDGRALPKIPEDKRWGATLGGPVIPDRLFFFGGYEEWQSSSAQETGPAGAGYTVSIPAVTLANFNDISAVLRSVYGIETGGLANTLPITNRRFFARGDLYITDDHRLEVTYQHLDEATIKPDDFTATGSSITVPGYNTFLKSGTTSDYVSARLYSQWTENFSTEARFSRSVVIDAQDPVGGGEAQSESPIPRILVGVTNGGVSGLVLAGPGNSRSANDLQTRINQYKLKASLVAGDHRFTLGGELNTANLFNLFVQNATGTLYFSNIADLREGLLSGGTGTSTTAANIVNGVTFGAQGAFSANGDINSAAAEFSRSIYSTYIQDDWRISDSLKVVLGLRADWYDGGHPTSNPNFAARYGMTNGTSFSNIDPVIQPRVGFTYDVGDFAMFSRFRVKGGVGIFSGGDPAVWFGNAFQNNGYLTATGNTNSALCNATKVGGRIDVVTGGTFTGVPACVVAAGSAIAAAGAGNVQSVDPDLKMPTVIRANIGFETEFGTESGLFSNWHLGVDYIWSRFRNPLSLVDLSQTIDFRKGLAGYTIDGRPLYQAIDPTIAGCTAVYRNGWTNVNTPCFNTTTRFDELQLTNLDAVTSQVASIVLSKEFQGGLFTDGGKFNFNIGYAYTDSHDRRNMYNSTAGSNYDQTAAFDRQNPDESTGFFNTKHNATLNMRLTETFIDEFETNLGLTFVARSGRPYSLTYGGSGAFYNSNSGFDNALLYIPTGINDPNLSPSSSATAVQSLLNYVNALDCAKKYAGRTIERNSCDNDWFFDMDLSFSQEVPGPGRFFGLKDSIRLYAMVDNFLNLIDTDWNVMRRRQFSGLVNVVDVPSGGPVDSQGRYIISAYNPDDSNNIVNGGTSSSAWRIKIGASYKF